MLYDIVLDDYMSLHINVLQTLARQPDQLVIQLLLHTLLRRQLLLILVAKRIIYRASDTYVAER
jgi:hypothetical protein